MNAGMDWRSVLVYYYDERMKDDLVLHGVRPLFATLRDRSVDAYFQRHWRQGPHLRLHFRSSHDIFVDVVRPAVAEFIGAYLAARPSCASLVEQDMVEGHRELARAEKERGPLTPFLPDNSIHEVAYDARSRTVGGPKASELLAKFYVATNDVAFDMIQAARDGGPRLSPCFDLMVGTAHAFAFGGFRFGFVSFRSHAEVFLAGSRDPESLRSKWDRQYSMLREPLRKRAQDILDANPAPPTILAQWLERVGPVAERASFLMARGEMSFDDSGPERRIGPMSSFHRALRGGEFFMLQVKDSDWFQRYRAVLNYLYLHLSRIGIRPMERFLLCHFAGNAAEDLFGVSAIDIAKGGLQVPVPRPSV